MTISSKITVISLILVFSIGYSLFHKKSLDSYFHESRAPILKVLPKVELSDFYSGESVDLKQVASEANGVLVHFWGTWCAPCEYELPEFLELSRRLEKNKVKVVLLSVNDDDSKMKKFLKRFGKMPANIIVIHDKNGSSMKPYGVVKVPETFVFDKSGRNLLKFAGPQDWKMPSYERRILNYLGL